MSEEWVKKSISTKAKRFKPEDYVKKKYVLEVSAHFGAFISDKYFMDYMEYRLNLDHGTDGLVILDNITLIKENDNEISNET